MLHSLGQALFYEGHGWSMCVHWFIVEPFEKQLDCKMHHIHSLLAHRCPSMPRDMLHCKLPPALTEHLAVNLVSQRAVLLHMALNCIQHRIGRRAGSANSDPAQDVWGFRNSKRGCTTTNTAVHS